MSGEKATPEQWVYNPVPKIVEYFERLSKLGRIEGLPEALPLLVHARELLEHLGAKDRFPIANLYSNWILHTSLCQSPAGYNLLRRVNDHLCDAIVAGAPCPEDQTRQDEFVQRVGEELSTAQLRIELRELLAEAGFTPRFLLTDGPLWMGVRDRILHEVKGRPIEYSSSKRALSVLQTARNRWIALEQPDDWTVRQFFLIRDPMNPRSGAAELELHWIVTLQMGGTLRGRLVLER